MKKALQDKEKKNYVKHFIRSTKYTLEGLNAAFKEEKSFHIWTFCFIIVMIIGILLKITFRDFLIFFFLFGLLLAVELLNTAIENTIDLVTSEIHPLAKKAKDCGSAASGVIVLLLVIIGIAIFYPYILVYF